MTKSDGNELLHIGESDRIRLVVPPQALDDGELHDGNPVCVSAERPSLANGTMSPTITAIRGQGLSAGHPSIVVDAGDDSGQRELLNPRKKAMSDAGSDVTVKSRITVSDRGESLWVKAYSPGGDAPPQVARPLRPEKFSIVERLMTLRCRPKGPGGPVFYPRGSIEALITEEVVVRELTSDRLRFNPPLSDDKIHQYAALVCRFPLPDGRKFSSYKKIFAILVLLKRAWEVVLFVDASLCDADLPLVAVTIDQESELFKMRHKRDLQADLDCLRNWDLAEHENFDLHQWAMLAPWFAHGEQQAHFYELDEKDVMPWLSEIQVAEGGYGVVKKVKIHPCHHNFEATPWSDGYFAIKQFKENKYATTGDNSALPSVDISNNNTNEYFPTDSAAQLKKDFEREIEILNRFSGKGRGHDHLISLLAAYQRGDECCLIFRWAHSDLRVMLRSEIALGSTLQVSSLRWLIEQCRGVADGLQRIHKHQTTEVRTKGYQMNNGQIYGRHGDIKPENILLFKNSQDQTDRGRLVITDFGLTRFHNHSTKTYLKEQKLAATPTYRPPECDMEDQVTLSRSFDIWSLGCVFLECITWYLGGWTLVDDFVQHRKAPDVLLYGFNSDQFFEIVREEGGKTGGRVFARVKIEVHQFVNKLHSHEHCSDVIHQFLDFIMENMLVIESKNIQERARCEHVHQELERLYQIVFNPLFQVVPRPRPKVNITKIPEAVEMPLSSDAKRITENRFESLKQHTGNTRKLPVSSHLNVGGRTQGHYSRRRQSESKGPFMSRALHVRNVYYLGWWI
ncbi:hypothetical protein QBC38DRAFT_138014 [Podospora fimiseda]|uniref:Protein kinase domain-containing protein n=1 Tax=Podospora fimiseda TaxID=252190 RepID=A0AAN6YL42_9PEZI|nr:hypothetical protein QBC38DRAFT_138014 [Podospora fimiseda]